MARIRIGDSMVELPSDVDAVQRVFARQTVQGHCRASGTSLANGAVRIQFTTPSEQRCHEEGNRVYAVHPFTQAQDRLYWIGLEIILKPHLGAHIFDSIGVVVFFQRGTALEPVLRAEWDKYDEGQGRHAQPHWHVYMTAAEHQTRTRFMAFENDQWRPYGEDDWMAIDRGAVASDEQRAIAKFHFAMASTWHTGGANAHYEAPDEQKIERWLSGCLTYVREQLTYVVHGLPRGLPF